MEKDIVNRIALSPLITLDLADHYEQGERMMIDVKDQLFHGMILKEKDFRAYIKAGDWSSYSGKHVLVTCSADAIVPAWAYMLLAMVLEPFAMTLVFGNTMDDLEQAIYSKAFDKLDFTQFEGKKIIVKGCGDIQIPEGVFFDFSRRLRPYAAKLMYGEACSSVPVYKKRN